MPTALETDQDFMAALIEAWPSADTAIESTFAQFMKVGGEVDVEMIHMMAQGPIVMTERIDHLTRADGTTASLPMMGVIEIHDGLVAAWRDYFDLSQFTSQILGGS